MSRARDMANLGAQAGSGLDASDITAGTLGNTVQDNITRLGTVTTGTLSHGTTLQGYVDSSNTGVTFPAGHIIQVIHDEETAANKGSTSGNYPVASGFKKSITPHLQTSKILVIFNIHVWLTGGSNGNKIGKFGIRLNDVSGTPTVADKRFGSNQEYEVVMGRWSNGFPNTVTLNGGGFGHSTVTLMEVTT